MKSRTVPASELNPKKGLRARDYVEKPSSGKVKPEPMLDPRADKRELRAAAPAKPKKPVVATYTLELNITMDETFSEALTHRMGAPLSHFKIQNWVNLALAAEKRKVLLEYKASRAFGEPEDEAVSELVSSGYSREDALENVLESIEAEEANNT